MGSWLSCGKDFILQSTAFSSEFGCSIKRLHGYVTNGRCPFQNKLQHVLETQQSVGDVAYAQRGADPACDASTKGRA